MNCPSRTDDITLDHPSWNQSPRFLAPELTTCADLNGNVNRREHREGGTGDGSLADNQGENDYLTHPHLVPDRMRQHPDSAGRWAPVAHPRPKDALGGEGQPRPTPVILSQTARPSTVWGWILWTASVLVCSSLLSALRTPGFLSSLFSSPAPAQCTVQDTVRDDAVLVSRSLPVKRSTCGGGGANLDEYNLPLHVGGLFIILGVSFFSCAFALIAKKVSFIRIPAGFFFAVRHFGTGVLLATAFVHLLPTAFTMLGNPCLSSFWVDDYPAMPGAIALAAVFFVAIIEMVFQPARHLVPSEPANHGVHEMAEANSAGSDSDESLDNSNEPLHGTSNSLGRTLSRMSRDPEITRTQHGQGSAEAAPSKPRVDEETVVPGHHGGSFAGYVLTPAQKHQKDILQCMMLEVGILFHSIFIGMTLSVSTGNTFVILLIAISFHQTFEGLALGSRIAAISWHKGAVQPWLMALAYGCTTPLGQAIGIATHALYDPESEFGLVLVGTMNAISSGLLVFASLVELLSEDFLSDESWRVLRGKKRVVACLLVFAGAFGMSIVGAWA
ncbi:zinc-regulated transporter 1 [Plectosphaerella plurivora]|uniref:Zinc-regulated transporter 1 n=1 Tax=Plectosphaerella plurivora TaxID=936078 RepID=A0A9P9A8V6_9PEZI|nr:zinc-regulated transporter 1 [Plectosphaerella plurivora]